MSAKHEEPHMKQNGTRATKLKRTIQYIVITHLRRNAAAPEKMAPLRPTNNEPDNAASKKKRAKPMESPRTLSKPK
eukprot:5872390-Lingulodinium_polyedra.AAC.1